MKKTISLLLMCSLLAVTVMNVQADRLSDLQKQKEELEQQQSELQQQASDTQSAIDDANTTAGELQGSIDELSFAMDEINSSIVEIMAEISLLEDDIAVKEADIAVTQAEYAAAVEKEQQQYNALCVHIKYMYETGDMNYVALLLTAQSVPDMLNKVDYVEALYQYDQDMLTSYQETVAQVAALEAQLELELADLQLNKTMLDAAQAELDTELAILQAESSNYALELAEVQITAANYSAQLKEQKKQLSAVETSLNQTNKEIKAEQAALAAQAQTSTVVKVPQGGAVFNADDIWNANGSDLGKQIAAYACSFIGNPYVLGGTSLTNGADCSGFTQAVYAQFSYRIPRTSYEQRNCGTEVSYSDAQPGDLICYAGHVALYIGNGKIVHASSAKTGIKISYANYRTILSVRRVL